jgi:hypothetical protein
MSVGHWFRAPRRLLAVFLVIVLVPSALLVISGWRLLRHEEVVAAQELRSQRERMADEVVTVPKQRIEAVRAQLRDPGADFTFASKRTDFVFAVFNADGVRTTPARRLLFYPVTLAGPEVSSAALDAGAIGAAQKFRRMGRTDAALAAYARAAALTNASIAGIPTDLFARYSECLVLAEAGRTDQLKAKASALHADLLSGRWQLNHAAFQANLEDAARWSGAPPLTAALERARALSTAVRWMWDRWKASPAALTGSGSDLLVVDGDFVGPPDGMRKGSGFTLVWSADRDRLALFRDQPLTERPGEWTPHSPDRKRWEQWSGAAGGPQRLLSRRMDAR